MLTLWVLRPAWPAPTDIDVIISRIGRNCSFCRHCRGDKVEVIEPESLKRLVASRRRGDFPVMP
jgi:hypothetical protein